MTTTDHIDDLWVKKPIESRYHLGCSGIGHKCDRKLWISFRHVFTEQFDGRMLRLFRLGHDWEQFFVRDLLEAGVDIIDQDLSFDDGRQLSVDFGYHISQSHRWLRYKLYHLRQIRWSPQSCDIQNIGSANRLNPNEWIGNWLDPESAHTLPAAPSTAAL